MKMRTFVIVMVLSTSALLLASQGASADQPPAGSPPLCIPGSSPENCSGCLGVGARIVIGTPIAVISLDGISGNLDQGAEPASGLAMDASTQSFGLFQFLSSEDVAGEFPKYYYYMTGVSMTAACTDLGVPECLLSASSETSVWDPSAPQVFVTGWVVRALECLQRI